MTIAQALQWSKQTLTAHQVSDDGVTDSALVDARVLLAAALDCQQVYLHTWPEKTLSFEQQTRFERFIDKRCEGQPVAYIVGYREFWSLNLKVSPSTLIPRSDTECLVEQVLALPLKPNTKMLDMGTGTGAIALACAAEQPSWRIVGIDKSADAVVLAKQNADLNQLPQVSFLQSDWFNALPPQSFDLIVSNPPYVEQNSPYLTQGDVRFEPLSALTSGDDGLQDIQHIAKHARAFLAQDGWLVLEHGFQQGERVSQILESNGYRHTATILDMNNLPRLTLAQK